MFKLTKDLTYWEKAVDFACFSNNFEALISTEEMREADHMFSMFEGVGGLVLFIQDILAMDGVEHNWEDKLVGFPCFNDV